MAARLTPKGAATKQRIIEGAAAEIRERGVTEVTLDDICARTATSKSQLFHYFPGGKEELLLSVAQHEADRILSDQQPYLDELTSWQALAQLAGRACGPQPPGTAVPAQHAHVAAHPYRGWRAGCHQTVDHLVADPDRRRHPGHAGPA
jgi:AcrR family transcriptional regulator